MSERTEMPEADFSCDQETREEYFFNASRIGVVGVGSTYDPTHKHDQQTNNQQTEFNVSQFQNYYQYRITVPHKEFPKLQTVFCKYSKQWCAAFHYPHDDGVDAEDEKSEHFHCAFIDMSESTVYQLRRSVMALFDRKGNALHSGKHRDNFATNFVKYCRHQPDCEFKFWGLHWQALIDSSPEYEERVQKKAKIEHKNPNKLSYPTLTKYNVIRQAMRWKAEHKLKTHDLGTVCEHMARVGNWQPDPGVMKTGFDPMHFKLFEYKSKSLPDSDMRPGKVPNFWDPRSI